MGIELYNKEPKSILNKGTGFLSGYTHSLNPMQAAHSPCSFCYVRQMPVSLFRQKDWGTWVDVKRGAADVLRRQLRTAKKKGPVTIFMSSSTDLYQPIEHKEQVTRSLLEVMAEEQPDFLSRQGARLSLATSTCLSNWSEGACQYDNRDGSGRDAQAIHSVSSAHSRQIAGSC